MGVEPPRAVAKRTNGRGPKRAIGAPWGTAAGTTESTGPQMGQQKIPRKSLQNLNRNHRVLAQVRQSLNSSA